MTTAHRPTWNTAIGSSGPKTFTTTSKASRDIASHTKMKYRQLGQGSKAELQSKLQFKLNNNSIPSTSNSSSSSIEEDNNTDNNNNNNMIMLDEDADAFDASSDGDSINNNNNNEEEDDDDSDDDDELELQRELEKIRAERALAKQQEEAEEAKKKERLSVNRALSSNPLLDMNMGDDNSGSSKVKRRWNDDVVFKNQASDLPKNKKRFINDAIRSDFHKSFMKKYIK